MMTIAFVQLSPGALFAREKKKDENKSSKKLTPRGEMMLARYKALRTHLSKIAVMIKDKDPKTAALIEKALKESAELDIEKGMQNVIKALKQGDTDGASYEQKAVVKALQEFYSLIKKGSKDNQQSPLEKEREKLEKELKKIDELIKENDADERKNNAIVNKEEIQKNVDKLISDLENAIKNQKQIMKDTKAGASKNPPQMSELQKLYVELKKHHSEQENLNEITRKAALSKLPIIGKVQEKYGKGIDASSKKISAVFAKEGVKSLLKKAGIDEIQTKLIVEKCNSATEKSGSSAKFLKRSNKSRGAKYQEQIVEELSKAIQLFADVIKKIAATTPTGKIANAQKNLGDKTGELSGKMKKIAERANIDLNKLAKKNNNNQAGKKGLDKAASNMKKSTENLQAGKPNAAQKSQQKALDMLEKQLKLAKNLKTAAGKNGNKKIDPKNSARIAKKANDIAKGLKDPKLGTMAGQKAMKQAAKNSSNASKKLSQSGKQQQQQGAQSQQQASKDMKNAKEQIQDRLAKINHELKKKKLRGIRDRLAQILELQQTYSEQTKDTYELRVEKTEDKYEREEEQLLNGLSTKEAKLGELIQEIVDMLEKETKKSAVFPDALRDLKEDLNSISQKLLDKQAGSYTQLVQSEVETTLEQMIDSISKELSRLGGFKKRKKGGGGGGKGGGKKKKQPLLPPIADLKMLRSKQVRINRIAKQLKKMSDTNKIDNETFKRETQKLGERERKLRDFINKMNKKSQSAPKEEDMAV